MSGVRVLVGTRKGAFILTSDGKRENWDVSGPHFGGWEIYHLKGSPADPNRIYASQSSGWFGQLIQRSDDGGKTWEPVGQQVRLRRRPRHAPVVRRHAASVGVQARLAPRAVADRSGHGLRRRRGRGAVPHDRRRRRRGTSCPGCASTAPDRTGSRAPAACACTRSSSIRAIRSASSSPSPPPARSAPTMAARRGSRSTAGCSRKHIPDPNAEVGHCVHRIAMHRRGPDVLFMQKHWDVMRSDDARRHRGSEVSGNLPTDFGFAIDVHAHEPETIYVVPIKSDSEHYPPDGKLRVYRSRSRRQRVGAADQGPAADATATSTSCATRWPSTRSTRAASTSARPAARSTRRPTPATTGRRSSAICRRSVGRGADAAMIRVVLPAHLRTLARVGAAK